MIITHNNIILKNEGIILNKITTVPPTPPPPFVNTYSLDFDGVDDVLSLGENSTVGNGGVNTISFWVKGSTQSSGGITNYLFSNYGAYNWWRFFHADGTNLYWRNINGVAFNIAPNVFDGNWHNIVVIRNPSDLVDGSLRIYVDNGTPLDRTLDFRYGVAGLYNGALGTIGNNNTSNSGFNGNIDEVAVWNSEITPSDVATLSTAPTVDLTPLNPIAWYRMGDNGAYKSPQWLIPNNENKDKISNYSFEFDGVDDDFTSGDLSSLVDNKSKLSISFWVNLPDASEINRITGKYGGSLTKWLGVTCASNKVSFVVSNIGSSLAYAETSAVLSNNTWHHVVCAFDGTQATATDRIKIYVDNTDEALNFNNTLPTSTYDFTLEPTNPTWYLGQVGLQLGNNELRGKLNEYAIYSDVALTDLEVNEIYNGGVPNDLSSLSVTPDLWYKMGEEANFTSNWLVDNSALGNYSKRSFEFDGIDDRVQLSSDFVASGEFTLSFWMKPVAVTGNGNIFPIGTFPGNSNYVKLDQIGVMWLRLGGATIIFNEAVFGGGANNLVLNDWQNIVFIRDSSNVIRCYRNGVDFGYNVAAATNSNTLTLNSFGRIITNTFGYEGGLDEIAFWNSDETANLSTIYNGGEPTTLPSGAVAHWRMGEDASFNGTNWTVPDQVGTNNGTSNAMLVDALVGEAPNYSGGGISNGMTIEDRVGNAPNSDNNVLSINMEREDRIEDTP